MSSEDVPSYMKDYNMAFSCNKKPNMRHMRCDNHLPRCEKLDESVNHTIFQCPQALNHIIIYTIQFKHFLSF